MKLSDIDLRLLQVFRAVAESGGFAKAQGVLGISQPTISSHIANLEQRLQLTLCLRGPQGFSLTDEGKEVLKETVSLLDYLDAATNRLKNVSKRSIKRLRIGVIDATVSNADNPLPAALGRLCKADASLVPSIFVSEFLACIAELRAERLDLALFAIGTDEQVPDDLEAQFLFNEISHLYCAPDHKAAQSSGREALETALQSSNVSAHSFTPAVLEGQENQLLTAENTVFSQGALEATTYAALAGSHVGVLPRHVAAPWVASGELVCVAQDLYEVTSRFFLVRLKDGQHSGTAEQLWQSLASG